MLINRTEQKLSRWARGLHLGGLLIAMTGCSVMLLAVIIPLSQDDAEVVAREQALRKILDLEPAVTSENERLTQVLAEADIKIQSLLDRIPNVARESDFLGQVTTLAKDVEVEIMNYLPGNIRETEEYNEMSLSITSQGSYDGICNFLNRMHSLPRLSRTSKLSLAPVVNGKTYSLNMTLTIFFSPTSELASAIKEANRG